MERHEASSWELTPQTLLGLEPSTASRSCFSTKPASCLVTWRFIALTTASELPADVKLIDAIRLFVI
jgi:hypothetical protein